MGKNKCIQSNKDTERYGLQKVPDEIIIKVLRVELGKANAYIVELEELAKEPAKMLCKYKQNAKGERDRADRLQKEVYRLNFENSELKKRIKNQ